MKDKKTRKTKALRQFESLLRKIDRLESQKNRLARMLGIKIAAEEGTA